MVDGSPWKAGWKSSNVDLKRGLPHVYAPAFRDMLCAGEGSPGREFRATDGGTSIATASVAGLAAYFLALPEAQPLVGFPHLLKSYIIAKAWVRPGTELLSVYNNFKLPQKEACAAPGPQRRDVPSGTEVLVCPAKSATNVGTATQSLSIASPTSPAQGSLIPITASPVPSLIHNSTISAQSPTEIATTASPKPPVNSSPPSEVLPSPTTAPSLVSITTEMPPTNTQKPAPDPPSTTEKPAPPPPSTTQLVASPTSTVVISRVDIGLHAFFKSSTLVWMAFHHDSLGQERKCWKWRKEFPDDEPQDIFKTLKDSEMMKTVFPLTKAGFKIPTLLNGMTDCAYEGDRTGPGKIICAGQATVNCEVSPNSQFDGMNCQPSEPIKEQSTESQDPGKFTVRVSCPFFS